MIVTITEQTEVARARLGILCVISCKPEVARARLRVSRECKCHAAREPYYCTSLL